MSNCKFSRQQRDESQKRARDGRNLNFMTLADFHRGIETHSLSAWKSPENEKWHELVVQLNSTWKLYTQRNIKLCPLAKQMEKSGEQARERREDEDKKRKTQNYSLAIGEIYCFCYKLLFALLYCSQTGHKKKSEIKQKKEVSSVAASVRCYVSMLVNIEHFFLPVFIYLFNHQ